MNHTVEVVFTENFVNWLVQTHPKVRVLIANRLSRIEQYAHFGMKKYLGEGLIELKWKNGLRVYFGFVDKQKIIVLLGGTKNGQSKDIKKAKELIYSERQKYTLC